LNHSPIKNKETQNR